MRQDVTGSVGFVVGFTLASRREAAAVRTRRAWPAAAKRRRLRFRYFGQPPLVGGGCGFVTLASRHLLAAVAVSLLRPAATCWRRLRFRYFGQPPLVGGGWRFDLPWAVLYLNLTLIRLLVAALHRCCGIVLSVVNLLSLISRLSI